MDVYDTQLKRLTGGAAVAAGGFIWDKNDERPTLGAADRIYTYLGLNTESEDLESALAAALCLLFSEGLLLEPVSVDPRTLDASGYDLEKALKLESDGSVRQLLFHRGTLDRFAVQSSAKTKLALIFDALSA